MASGLDHHVVVLDADPEGLGHIGAFDQLGALLDRDAEAARLDLVGIAPGLAGADVELPGVPGAADDLPAAGGIVLAGPLGQDEPGEIAFAEAAAAMRAAVAQREKFAVEVE